MCSKKLTLRHSLEGSSGQRPQRAHLNPPGTNALIKQFQKSATMLQFTLPTQRIVANFLNM